MSRLIGKFENYHHMIQSLFVRMKIRTKFLLAFFLVILFIVVMVLVTVTNVSRSVFTDYSIELSSEFVDQIAANIARRIEDTEDLSYTIAQNNQIKEQLYESREGLGIYKRTLIQPKINAVLNSIAINNDYIDRIVISTIEGDYYWWEKQVEEKSETASRYDVEYHFNIAIEGGLTGDNSVLWLESPIYEDEVYLIRPIIDESDINEHLGYMLFTFKSNYLSGVDASDTMIESENVAIMSRENRLFLETELIDRRFYLKLVESGNYKIDALNHRLITLGRSSYLLLERAIAGTDWKVMILVPQSALAEGLSDIHFIIVILAFVSVVITGIIGFYISGNITRNLDLLESNMIKIESGDFNVRIKPVLYDEIGLISLRFNYMAGQIQSLIDKLYVSEVEKQKMELEVLKAQINPHFLYNTLGSIKWLAQSKGQEDISELVTSLIELLKASIKQKGAYLTLAQEINYIKNYMTIQKASLDGEIEVIYDIEPETEKFYVLNFMLQPIVENAIYHGLELRKGKAQIRIEAKCIDNQLIISVEDNGRGMDAKTIQEIVKQKRDKDYSGLNSIGVHNVNERLKIYFGAEYGLMYASELGEWTKVIFQLPMMDQLALDNPVEVES